MAKRQLVLAVDVGTTKVSALVGEGRQDNELAVMGIAATPVVGMRRGLVFEAERVALAIRDAVNRANSMASTEVSVAAISVGGEHLKITPGQARVALRSGSVRAEDVRLVIQKACQVKLPLDHEVVQIIRRGIGVDGFRGVMDPIGMVGHRLEAEVFVVSGLSTVLRNLRRVVAMAGLTPISLVAGARAAAEGVLGDDDRQLGVVLLDIGGGTTGVTIYRGGHLQHLGVVPIGGEAITADLAVGLGVVAAQAERLKLEYAQIGSLGEGSVEVHTVNGQSVKRIEFAEMKEIVDARIEEWAGFVEDQLRLVEWAKGPAAGVVITGGGALLKGMAPFLQTRWGWPVRIGNPKGLQGLSDLSRSPGYSTVVGVARSLIGPQAERPLPDWRSRLSLFMARILR